MLQISSLAPRLLAAGLALGPIAYSQQFSYQNGMIPGASRWTEGVEAVDVDGDGDLDLCFAEGDGFASAGTQRQQKLMINQLVETGSLSFTNESTARLGIQVANGKGVTTGDVNGDGWVDLLYVNAFNTDPPFLFINRGAAQPGFFDMESSIRGFTENLSSGSAQFGDLDDDGDLDVIICDSGSSFLGGSGGKPRLFINDGNGFFTEAAASLNAPTKKAHMDVHLVDLDGDWDVDFVGLNRASNSGGTHYVMLNDGNGTFTDASNLMPSTSSSVYEAEVSDLDGDDDIDLYFVSLSGFQEGPMRNNLVESGSLGFQAGNTQNGNVDDNEVVLMDYDNDGDLDAFIGSLGTKERVYRNDGGLNFQGNSSVIQTVTDSTLDMTAADLDNDGTYDLITAQGESNAGQWVNKVYLNSGPADSIAPRVVGVHVPSASGAWPIILKSKHQDGVMDDGVDYVSTTLFATPALGTGGTSVLSGGAFAPAVQNLQSGAGLVLSNMSGAATTIAVNAGPASYGADLAAGQSAEVVLVLPGNYTLVAMPGGATLSVVVSGTPTQVGGGAMGVGQRRYAVPQQGASPSDTFAAVIRFRDWVGNESFEHIAEVNYPGGLGGAVNYCGPANNNSTGQPASIAMSGSFIIAQANFGLTATNLPPNQFGFFLVSGAQAFIPNAGGSAGNLCLGAGIGRFNSQIQNSGVFGIFGISVDLGSLPLNPNHAVLPGETWNFQAWYRDTGGMSNFTDGVSVTFQ